MSRWGIDGIDINLVTFYGDGFRLDFEPYHTDYLIKNGTFPENRGRFISYQRAALFQLDFNTSRMGAYSSARNARCCYNFATESLEEPYWVCVANKRRRVFL